MSVEEAAADIVRHILRNHDHNGEPKETEPVNFDRLIFEVRAAMPCEHYIREWDGAGLLRVCRRAHDPCPSCTARAELARVTA